MTECIIHPTDDLIRRLREYRTYTEGYDFADEHPICNEAADEIERLLAVISKLANSFRPDKEA